MGIYWPYPALELLYPAHPAPGFRWPVRGARSCIPSATQRRVAFPAPYPARSGAGTAISVTPGAGFSFGRPNLPSQRRLLAFIAIYCNSGAFIALPAPILPELQIVKKTYGFISVFTISRVPEAPDCDMGLDSGAYTALESIGPAGTATRNPKLHKKCYPAPESATRRRKVLPGAGKVLGMQPDAGN